MRSPSYSLQIVFGGTYCSTIKPTVQGLQFGPKTRAYESNRLNSGFSKTALGVALTNTSFPTVHGSTWLPPSKNLLWMVLVVPQEQVCAAMSARGENWVERFVLDSVRLRCWACLVGMMAYARVL